MEDYFSGGGLDEVWAKYNLYQWLVVVLLLVIMVLCSVLVHYTDAVSDNWWKFWDAYEPKPTAAPFRDRMSAPGGFLGGSLNTLRDDTGAAKTDSLAEKALKKNRFTEHLVEAGREMNNPTYPSGEDLATIMALQNSGNPAGFRDRLEAKKPENHVNY